MASSGKSIRRRLMTMMMLTCAASIAFTSVTFILYEFIAARNEAHERLATLARVVASNSTAALAFRADDDAYQVLDVLRTEPEVLTAALYDEKGLLFAAYPRDALRTSLPQAPAGDGLQFRGDVLEGFQTVSEVRDRPLGTLFIRADMNPMYQRFWF